MKTNYAYKHMFRTISELQGIEVAFVRIEVK